MKVTQITVSAGRVIAHPTENYSNLRPQITLTAVLEDGEDASAATKELQAKAEGLVEDHANHLTKHIRDMYYLAEKEKEVARLEQQILQSQKRLEDVRGEIPLMLESNDAEDSDGDTEEEDDRW